MLRSHLRALFGSQPPEEGRLGSANASPRGGPGRGLHSPVCCSEPCRYGMLQQGGTCPGWVPEVERKFQIQIMVLGVRPGALPGTGVRCAQAPGWRLCLIETWAAARSPSCARWVVGSDLNHQTSSCLLLKAMRKCLAALKSDLGVVTWRWVVWSSRGRYRGTLLPFTPSLQEIAVLRKEGLQGKAQHCVSVCLESRVG